MSRLRLLWLAVAVLGPALGAAADFREIHQRGVEALEQQRWQDAVRFFDAAIAERTHERAGGFGRRYLPHFYLGVALAELGDCHGALESWNESERQGKIARAKDLAATLPEKKRACREHLQRVELAGAEVEDLLRQAESTAPTLEALAKRLTLAPIWSRGEESYAARVEQARQRLAEARRRLVEGRDRSDLDLLGGSRDLAAQALGELRALVGDARRQLSELNAAADRALEEVAAIESAALEAVRSVFDLQPYPPGLASRVRDLQQTLQRIEERRDVALAPELQELGAELQGAIERLQSAAARPSPTLFEAVEAFLDGRYQEVLERLEDFTYSRGRSAVHACHLEAASRQALYVLGGETQAEMLDLARQRALVCHQLEPSFSVPRKYFSPRYLEFYDHFVHPPQDDEPSPTAGAGTEPEIPQQDAASTQTSEKELR